MALNIECPHPTCPARRLESALPDALEANKQALDAITALFFHFQGSAGSGEFGEFVNRTKAIGRNVNLELPLLSNITATDVATLSKSETDHNKGHSPVWLITIKGVVRCFDKIFADAEGTSPRLIWVSSSITRPGEETGPKFESPLGFEDIVILHLNPKEPRNGREVLDRVSGADGNFMSLSKAFFKVLELKAEDRKSDEEMRHLEKDCLGVWICPRNEPAPPAYADHVFKVEANSKGVPPPATGDGLFAESYARWRQHHVDYGGTFKPYFRAFDKFDESDLEEDMNLLFCPVLYRDNRGQIRAGANISLGVRGALSDDHVREMLACLYALQAGLAATTVAFSLALRQMREMRRSHQLLMSLQRPLDALTGAFNTVQAEAQEMQAILNDPEEGIFKAHKVLAPLYHQGHPILVSRYLELVSQHDWKSDEGFEKLQTAYCYALCCIFGVQNRLLDAQTSVSLAQMASSALKEKREALAHDRLIRLLSVICRFTFPSVETSVFKAPGENELQGAERFSNALRLLKNIAFTPFKSFGQHWPQAPVQVAAITEEVAEEKDEKPVLNRDLGNDKHPVLRPQDTPFSQQAILAFILGVKSLVCARMRGIKSGQPITALTIDRDASSKDLKEYRLDLSLQCFGTIASQEAKSKDPSVETLKMEMQNLQDCIASTIRHGIAGKVMGSFHGVFQDLLRHALNLTVASDAATGSWVHLKPPDPTYEHAILLALGRIKEGAELNDTPKLCGSSDLCDRYFAIVQESNGTDHSSTRLLRVIWSASAAEITMSILTTASNQTAAESNSKNALHLERGVPKNAQSVASEIWIVDHDEGWFTQLHAIEYLKSRLKQHSHKTPAEFTPTSRCIVILHVSDDTDIANWKARLTELHDAQSVARVIVVSSRGHPSEKGIEKSKLFEWGVHELQAIQPQHLQLDGAGREAFLRLLELP